MNRITSLLLIGAFALFLAHCGQKGGLTRPEQTELTLTSK